MENGKFKIQDEKKNITSVNIIKTREDRIDTEFKDIMRINLEQVRNGDIVNVEEAFARLLKE